MPRFEKSNGFLMQITVLYKIVSATDKHEIFKRQLAPATKFDYLYDVTKMVTLGKTVNKEDIWIC